MSKSKRTSGILLGVSSLPSKYGIGCFSKEAYEFVDSLAKAGQTYWQILPLGPTGYGDSPYQSFSAFACNPYFIDPDTLADEGLLEKAEYENIDFGDDPVHVDYGKEYEGRYIFLRKAYERSKQKEDTDYNEFCAKNADWLNDYALYMAVKAQFDGKSWSEWNTDIRMRDQKALAVYEQILADEIGFWKFLQYEAMKQWAALKAYANSKGVKIIGDIPIYVALDSADSWSNTELFQFTEENVPVRVAGCPPDAFAADGQLWGNPLYDWEYHEKTGYKWWIRRLERCFELYDVVRVDHFRGFDEYFAIPYGDATAANGEWQKGPGMKLFNAVREYFGESHIIAEDLGYVTESVEKLVRDSTYPGMKLIEFGFDSREAGDYMPYNYPKNSVVYTGTHDNQTLRSWFDELTPDDFEKLCEYLDMDSSTDREKMVWAVIRMTLGTVSETAIIPMQDYLCLGKEARMNQPSTMGRNWQWRILPGQFTDELAEKIAKVTALYGRK